MNDEENKIIEKIEKLIALSGSDNENEAKAAMLKAQELMAKYEIEQDRIDPERKRNARSFALLHRCSVMTGVSMLVP